MNDVTNSTEALLGEADAFASELSNTESGPPEQYEAVDHIEKLSALARAVLAERDEALKDAQKRELHHFETEVENTELRAISDAVIKTVTDYKHRIDNALAVLRKHALHGGYAAAVNEAIRLLTATETSEQTEAEDVPWESLPDIAWGANGDLVAVAPVAPIAATETSEQ